jgi:hypothetical protein
VEPASSQACPLDMTLSRRRTSGAGLHTKTLIISSTVRPRPRSTHGRDRTRHSSTIDVTLTLPQLERHTGPGSHHRPVSSNGTEIHAKRVSHSSSSLLSDGFRSGRSAPCTTDSAKANEYQPWKLMCRCPKGERRATSAASSATPSVQSVP